MLSILNIYKKQDIGIHSIFVYGSLRPDDDSGMAWTKYACDGMNYCKAIVKDHCMYLDGYASVKSNKIGKKVIGYILTPDPKRQDINWFDKLQHYDSIEGYDISNPDKSQCLYDRHVVEAINIRTKEKVCCYIYVRNDASEDYEVPNGDWLQRDRSI